MDKIKLLDFEKSNPVFMCEGCNKAHRWSATGWKCRAYAEPLKVPAIKNFGRCPLNQKEQVLTEKDKQRVRVGQQKTRRKGR